MHVLATAGHVDHGKSTLVRALTGMDPDRWAQERERGMTIDLGFVWATLPSGAQLAFVDVPGHERFVANMLAGVGAAPAVVFVVAADGGWSRQSEEHLTAIDALGLRHGLLVVTRADLADPGPARTAALARLSRSSLAGVDSVAVSAVTGAGMPLLEAALDRLVAGLPDPDADADVRLWLDRSFTIRGRGTVVTGTLTGGTLAVGDELQLAGSDRRVQVRGLETLKTAHDRVGAVARVAVNLRGVDHDEVGRGDALLTPGRFVATDAVDVRLAGLDAPDLAEHLQLHLGTAELPVRLRPLGTDTARLTLARPLPLRVGDRAVLRDPGQQLIVAGVTALDVRPPALGRRGAARRRAGEMAEMPDTADLASELSRRYLARAGELLALGVSAADLAGPGDRVVALPGDRYADASWWAEQAPRLRAEVDAYAEANAADPGMPVEVARQRLGLPDREVVELLLRPAKVTAEGGRLFGARRSATLPAPLVAALGALRADLAAAPYAAPDADRLRDLGLDARGLARLSGSKQLLAVGPGVYLLPGADEEAARRLAELPQPFTTSEARQALGSSRRVVLPLLELLDRQRRTVRVDDAHRRVRE